MKVAIVSDNDGEMISRVNETKKSRNTSVVNDVYNVFDEMSKVELLKQEGSVR